MKKIVSGILIASLLIGSPLTVFAKVTESTSSSVLESAPDTTASDTAVSEISPQASTTKTTDSTIKDAVKQSESVSSTEEKTESSSTESSASSTDNSVKTEKKTASVKKALTKATTQELSTDFLDRTKRFSENQFQNVAEIQDWLNTYDVFSLDGAQIVNYPFTGSVAIISGGLNVKNTSVSIKDSSKSDYGAIINGPLYVENNTLSFDGVSKDKGVYSDYSLQNQVTYYNSPRPTGTGAITGLGSETDSKVKSFSDKLREKELTIPDFLQAILNQSTYLDGLGIQQDYSGTTVVKNSKYELADQPKTYVYDMTVSNNKLTNINFSDFSSDDTVIVNVHDTNGTVDIQGGYNLNGANVIWNFPTAETITNNVAFKGKIIAPKASITTNQSLDGGIFLKFGFGDASSIEKARIKAQSSVDVPLNSDINKFLSNEKQFIEAITTHNGITYQRDTNNPNEQTSFSKELSKIQVTYFDKDNLPITKSEIDTKEPDAVYYIRYTYDNNNAIAAVTRLVIQKQIMGALTLSKIPNLNFGTIKLGSGTIQLGLEGFQVSDSPAASNGTDEGIIQITDTRANGKWNLTLSLEDNNFKLSNSNSDSIGGRLNLSLSEGGNLSTADPNSTEPSSTLSGSGTKTYNVDKNSTLELEINKSPTKVGTYQGTLNWKLSDTVN
ncbi:collagen-binding domain-containing protein [Enterococcus sp. S86.2]|uniref:collagen-binding domain-containing protein n=1 Tax=Enterococcus sp. S86.2 TaxID=3031299 RepID=UPI0026EA0717|nr:collagen-binding domain-containing protein [Enterococcus sp. S86.2]